MDESSAADDPSGLPGLASVCEIARDLIRIDTTNHGGGRANGEQEAAGYVRRLLEGVGLECQVFEPEPGRTSVVARWRGSNPSLPALMLHGHLDVVPADPTDWSADPFGGLVKDGMLWGRGAVDMKGMNAMIIAAVRAMIIAGEVPQRDIVLAFFADEEDGCRLGSVWMVDNHPDLFTGVTAAISEVGGYSVDIRGRRAYLIQTGEKGVLWIRLTTKGRAGHASQVNDESAITALAQAVARVGTAPWPVSLTPTTTDLLARVRELARLPADAPPQDVVEATGFGARFIGASLRNVGNVTIMQAGYKENVVPESAAALLDLRFLPGQRDDALEEVRRLVGEDVALTIELDLIALEHPFDGPLVERMVASLGKFDPTAVALPYLMPAATDNKALSRLGIRGFGFAPLKLPADLDFPALFHGVDERVPLDALTFGQAVLTDLLRTY